MSLVKWTPESLAAAAHRVRQVETDMWARMAAELLVFYGEIPGEFTEAVNAIIARYAAAKEQL